MNIIYLLLIVSLCLVVAIITLFLWTVKSGQYDDLDKPSYQILMDSEETSRDKD